MSGIRRLSRQELVERIRSTIADPREPRWSGFSAELAPTEPAPYALIVGAGFSHGVVPLVRELMHETIGGYYYPDQDQTSMRRPSNVLRRDSAVFWAELNRCAARQGRPAVVLDAKGLPEDPGEAYQALFSYELINALFEHSQGGDTPAPGFLQRMQQQRAGLVERPPSPELRGAGERFLNGFLRYVLDPGCEFGYGSTGRAELNPAHIYLATLLEAQQTGRIGVFCRTIFTTNFDTLLQNALQMVNLLYFITDRPKDPVVFQDQESAIHLVYVHGSILRHNPASSASDVGELNRRNSETFRQYLRSRDILTVGYSGWEDGLMSALRSLAKGDRNLYWCDVLPEPSTEAAVLLRTWGERGSYVDLGADGADGLLQSLYRSLVSHDARSEPMDRYRAWSKLRFGN